MNKHTKEPKRFLAFDSCNNEYQEFNTLEEAQKWIEDGVKFDGEISSEGDDSKIYQLHSILEYVITDQKSNYQFENEEDDVDDTGSVWPYDNEWDFVGDIEFKQVNPETEIQSLRDKIESLRTWIIENTVDVEGQDGVKWNCIERDEILQQLNNLNER